MTVAARVVRGDCVEVMAGMDACSVDAVVCDPPYLLRFMGRAWDHVPSPREGQALHERWACEALRVLKPGGHLLAFGGTRTYHRLACAVEDAGFEIRDTIAWLYGSGFPKSLDVSKAIDAAPGAEREAAAVGSTSVPSTREARKWEGWGTALKPAYEPIVVAREPLSGTVAATVLEHGTGAINIDGCRIGTESTRRPLGKPLNGGAYGSDRDDRESLDVIGGSDSGRWPANVVLDPEAAATLDKQTGESTSRGGQASLGAFRNGDIYGKGRDEREARDPGYGDTGGASRFFYVPKASAAERNAGLDGFKKLSAEVGDRRPSGDMNERLHRGERAHVLRHNIHPTVKPISLMRWLVRLVTPPGGLVVDPFAGSGTTGIAATLEGFRFVGIEREEEYAAIADARLAWWAEHPNGIELVDRLEHERDRQARADAGQLGLFGSDDG